MRWVAILRASNINFVRGEIHVSHPQVANFAGAQTVDKGGQEHRKLAIPELLGSVEEELQLVDRETGFVGPVIFAATIWRLRFRRFEWDDGCVCLSHWGLLHE